MMRTGNPALNNQVFQIEDRTASTTMTLEGVATKTMVLLAVVVVVSAVVWWQVWPMLEKAGSETVQIEGFTRSLSNVPGAVYGYLFIGAISGLIVAIVTCFTPRWSPITAPIYAACEGVFLGAFSAMFEFMYPGIVIQAVVATFGTLATLLVAYRLRLVRATENFKLGVIAATGGIVLLYLASFIMGLFGAPMLGMTLFKSTGLIGIGFSVFVVIIAALNLVLDFDFIENGCAYGAPKYMEWYAGFGLLVTLIWLYIEIVRLLAKLQSRR
jgi:uncharacterized YccA/Bax inhibitor family protein